MTDYPLRGAYINLDRSIERRTYMQSQLKSLGLDLYYSRFPGVDGVARQLDQHYVTEHTAGALGCYLSHIGALDLHATSDKHLHIIEDDACIPPEFNERVRPMLKWLDSREWDIAFTHLGFHIYPESLQLFGDLFEKYKFSGEATYIDLQAVLNYGGLHSYIVNKDSIAKVASFLKSPKWYEHPVDTWINLLIRHGYLRAYACVPFITTLDDALQLSSTIRDQDQARMLLRGVILNNVLYFKADVEALERQYFENDGKQQDSINYLRRVVRAASTRS